MRNLSIIIKSFACLLLVVMSSTILSAQSPTYKMGSSDYTELADKALKHIESFQWAELYKMVSDDVELFLPDGGPSTRTSFTGKKAFMEFWNNYPKNSGNTKMTASDFVHVPLDIVRGKTAYSNVTGSIVISYFTLNMWYGAEETEIRMNFVWAFDKNKKISKIYSYYDRTPIIAAAQKNMLAQSASNSAMKSYMLMGNYIGAEGVSGLLADGGTAREKVIQDLVKSVGGKMTSKVYYTLGGDYDLYAMVDFPDEAAVATLALLVRSTGLVTVKALALMSPSVIDQAAKSSGKYRAPGK